MEFFRGFAAIFMCLCIFCDAVEASDKTLLDKICSGDVYNSISQQYFGVLIGYVEHEVVTNTSNHDDFDYYYEKTFDNSADIHLTIYGHGVCTTSLSPDDCSDCLKEAGSRLDHECGSSIGAQVQLRDCRIRYENYRFNNDL